MARTGQRLRKLLALRPRQHAQLLIATAYLARARMDLARTPAGAIISRLRERGATAPTPAPGFDAALAGWAIRTAAGGVPWRSDCLVQCLAADRWLRRHGVVADFRLGVVPSGNGTILGHAWLERDGVVLTGGSAVSDHHLLIGD